MTNFVKITPEIGDVYKKIYRNSISPEYIVIVGITNDNPRRYNVIFIGETSHTLLLSEFKVENIRNRYEYYSDFNTHINETPEIISMMFNKKLPNEWYEYLKTNHEELLESDELGLL